MESHAQVTIPWVTWDSQASLSPQSLEACPSGLPCRMEAVLVATVPTALGKATELLKH